jgi:hypothetical protein
MFPRLENFLAAFAVTVIAITAAFWSFPQNEDRIREQMGRIEEDRNRFEKTTGLSTAEFVKRTSTGETDSASREEDKGILETLDGPGR